MTNVVALPTAKPELTFDDFWKAYPRRVAKGDAKRAWAKAVRLASPEEIIAGALLYARLAEMPFIAYPATWLRAERWCDEEIVAHAPTVTSELDRLRQLAARWFTGPMTEFRRAQFKASVPDADIRAMMAAGLISEQD